MPDIADALHSTLGSAQFEIARRLAHACAELGCRSYIVGGTVRDTILGLPAADLDVSVVSPPDDFPRRVAEKLDARVVMVSQFGTAKLEFEESTLDLVMARSERYRSPGALPDVTSGSLDDDLARRDFTINSMAASLDAASWGQLFDPHGGQRDLESGLVRILHAKSFQDDATRIVRAARYASRFGFKLEEVTGRRLTQSIRYLASISAERLRHEFERVFEEPRVSDAVRSLSKWGALNPAGRDFSFDAAAWSGMSESFPPGSSERRLIGWGLLSLGSQAMRPGEIAARFNLDAEARSVSVDALRLMERLRSSSLVELPPSGRVALLEEYNSHAVKALSLSIQGRPQRTVLVDYLDILRAVRSELSGHEVLALGVPQGPHVGEVLQMLKNARLDRETFSRTDEILMVRRYVAQLKH